jgi:hypothetical protein
MYNQPIKPIPPSGSALTAGISNATAGLGCSQDYFGTDQAACRDGLQLSLLYPGMLLVLPAGHARHSFGNHLHNGGAFFCREIENGKFLLHTVPKVDAMRGLFVCNVSFSDAAKIGDVPLCRFAVDAHILDENCTPMYVTALAPACTLVEFSRLPSNIHCEGHWGMCAVGIPKPALS